MDDQLAEQLDIGRELLERLVIMMAEAYEAAERHPNPARKADIMETGVLTVMKAYEVSRSQRSLGVLGILARCSPHVPEELRECIEMAFHDSPLVDKVERRLNRIDFVTHSGTRSFDAAGIE